MPTDAPEIRLQRGLVVVGIVVLAFNLRPAAVSVGPVLDEVTDALGMGDLTTSLLTTLPVLAFATMGALAPRVARVLGLHRTTCAALLLVTVGLMVRSHVDAPAAFLVLTFLALTGMAVANVLLPSLVKLHFPDRVGTMTAVYSTALAVGLTCASVLTVPISDAYGGGELDWRDGLAVWAFTALVAAVPWLALARHDQHARAEPTAFGAGAVARTRIGWLMGLFFGLLGLQSYAIFGWVAKVYRDAGFSAHDAGLLLGIVTGIGIPLSWVIPRLTVRVRDPRHVLTAIMVFYPVGYLGLVLAPATTPWLWAACLGIGCCTFPFVLTLIGMRSRTPGGTAALSGFTQSVGYLVAVVGPFGVGALHAVSGGWGLPFGILLALCVPQYLLGLTVSRPAYVEDEIASTSKV